MNKEIKYNGYSASPGDHEALEGDLCVAMNLVLEHNTIRPVLPPKVIAQIPGDTNLPIDKGRRIVCIHQTSAFKHFIVAIEFDGLSPQHPPYTYLYRWDGTEGSGLVHLGYKAFTEIHKVEPIGNTLVVLADDGIHYYLWKQNAYHYLGTHMPELDLRFDLTDGTAYESDEHKVDWDSSGVDELFDDLYTPLWWFDSDDQVSSGASVGRDVGNQLRQAIMASLNQVAAKPSKEKMFAFPFFVRYGYRLYDGSVTMQSAPALMIPTLASPTVKMGWKAISNDRQGVDHPAKVKASLSSYKLYCKPLDMAQVEALAQWSDIISSVDVFISPQFFTYNQAAKDDDIELKATVTAPTNSMLKSQITDNGTFFLLKQARLSASMPQSSTLLQSGGGIVEGDYEPRNENIVVRELMSDDSGTHDELYAKKSFAYNGRINLAGVSKRLFSGFNPGLMWCNAGDSMSNTTTATVVIEADGREITVRSDEGVVYYQSSRSSSVFWFFYPNTGAKRAYLTLAGKDLELELIPHPTLNGAYFCSIDADAVQQESSSVPSQSSAEDRIVEQPNKVYTSEVNNPFYFPAIGINTVGVGEILGLCAAVRPVSTGQVGYADLYIFTDNGIWVAKINEKGTYSNVTLATGDICKNPDSITQMETSVLFTTDRGIMVISGSQAQCVSDAIDSEDPFTLAALKASGEALHRISGLSRHDIYIKPFRAFLENCRMLYDYEGQRFIVYNNNKRYDYAYIYSLESNKWGMMTSNIDYGVRSYPDALAVTRDGRLVNFSEPGDEPLSAQLLITRPLTLDLPDVLKTVNTVIQRGMFDATGRKLTNDTAPVRSVLYGSRDGYNWFPVRSSTNHYLRGFSGTPYKSFRIALLLRLKPGESISGCSIQFEPKYTNRLR